MSTDRVNELRRILRDNRPDTTDIYQPVAEAVARQDAALRANQEPMSAFREELAAERSATVSLKRLLYTMALPGLLGIGAMACIVLPFARGGHELTWPRLLAGLAALGVIQIGGAYIAGRFIGRRYARY